eukprot:TRINITY_DN9916_c0_g1_i7.p1 TRINITY_DN9916_c0_g1~~TRINITY_DN9916_c0_g1_i7.p1  ORF type:complete len:159 (-),score=16.16 TRINITY_DN9916_c0_g1_i7:34-510(-)
MTHCCWRRTGATILANNNVTELQLQGAGRGISLEVARGYIADSSLEKRKTSRIINGASKKASKLNAFTDAASTAHCGVKHVLQDSGPAEAYLGEENFPLPVVVVDENVPMCSLSVGMGGNSSSSSPPTGTSSPLSIRSPMSTLVALSRELVSCNPTSK